MGAARFYHLTRNPVEVTLFRLLTKALEAGLRVEVRGADAERLAWLDEKLWLIDDASFLPHGMAGDGDDDRQPVLLTLSEHASQVTSCVMAVHGAPVSAEDVGRLDRTFILFDGNDADALAHARGQWSALTAAGAAAEYWSEEGGRWEMKARKGGEVSG